MKNILITGGAGFIGSHTVRLMVTKYPHYHIVNLDKLTYAGNLQNLRDIENAPNYTFVRGDICDHPLVETLFREHQIDGVIHLAAESHVDRSITDPFSFARTNIMGTLSLLEAAQKSWGAAGSRVKSHTRNHTENRTESNNSKLFYHISTDEVYGSLPNDHTLFTEDTRYDPHSPYSASKASADHLVRAFYHTYGLPVILSNCSNNYGSHQFPEKLIPLAITNIRQNRSIPVYGKGENVRDWLFVEDHANAIDVIFHKGRAGHTYNVGGSNEWKNIDLVKLLITTTDKLLGRPDGSSLGLISFVEDRAGHDLRYAIDSSRLQRELGWSPSVTMEDGIFKTVQWYLENHF